MKYKRSVFRSLAMVTQLGLSVVTPVFLCIFAGYQLDTHFGWKTMVPLLILGVLAGGRCAWLMARNTLLQEKRDDDRERLLQESRESRTGATRPKTPSRILKGGPEGETEGKERDSDGMA